MDRRKDLPTETTIVVGESEALSYEEFQRSLARLIHGEEDWTTVSVPKPLAAAGAWLEVKSEPLVPDDFDQGEKPFVRPFMIEMADDHYELDTTRARELLGWEAKHSLRETLPRIVANLKADPLGWYRANRLTPPQWMAVADRRRGTPRRFESARMPTIERHMARSSGRRFSTWDWAPG